MNFKKEVITTKDGSKTIFFPDLNENYHSHHGALQEAMHVFIKYGLDLFADRSKVSIFEVGFGTGLNAGITAAQAAIKQQVIDYTAIELFPVDGEMIQELGYVDLLQNAFPEHNFYEAIMSATWNDLAPIHPHFSLSKLQTSLQEISLDQGLFDLVYFDAFGPRVQPEMWSQAHFAKLYSSLNEGGALVTYCAQGQVKRDLKAVGYRVENVPGPPGKREMTIAYK